MVAAYVGRLRHSRRPAMERAPLEQALGRVLAQPLVADRDQPPFARSTRDGFACRAAEISAHEPLRVAGSTHAGQAPAAPLATGVAWEIMTGAPVPRGADAVAMFEHVETADGQVRLLPPRTLERGENIVARGTQARVGDELLPVGSAIDFQQIALAASCGYAELGVFVRPRVAILTTGDELVAVEAEPGPGQIRNSNGVMLASMVAATGAEPWLLPVAADTAEALDAVLQQAFLADMLLVTGGVSAGKFDLVEPALERAGARFHFTGVRIQPGKPVVFGQLPKSGGEPEGLSIPLFGLPGNPISSAVTFLLFAVPVLAALKGSREAAPRFALAKMGPKSDRGGKTGLTRFLPAFCTFQSATGELPQVEFVSWQGSGDLVALARSNCFIVVPEDTRYFEPGDTVRILLS